MAPIMASHCSHVDILVIMVAPTRMLGVGVSSQGGHGSLSMNAQSLLNCVVMLTCFLEVCLEVWIRAQK